MNITFANFENSFYIKLTQRIWDEFETKGESILTKSFSQKPSFEIISEGLLKKEIACAVFPLSMIPIEKPEGIVITALSKRQEAKDILLVKTAEASEGKLLKLKEGGSVSVFTEMQKIQLLQFRPDLKITKLDWSFFFENDDLKFETDGMILPAAFAEMFEHNYIKFELQPSEFIPTPGQGALAFLTLKENLPTRRFLKKIHQREVSACTNIERRLQQQLDHPTACFCFKNSEGHFQAWATAFSTQLKYSKIASRTSIDLVNKIAEEL